MFLRYGIEDSNFVGMRIRQSDLHIYYSTAQPLQSTKVLSEMPPIPLDKLLVIAGGRTSLAQGYRTFGPERLLCKYPGFDQPGKPRIQVIRQKRTFATSYTALVFGVIAMPDKVDQNTKYPVYDLKALDMSRAAVADFLATILRVK